MKPLGRHLKGLHDYAGATILGDGHVAVILDVAGLAARAKLTAGTTEATVPADGGGRAPRAASCTRCWCFIMRPERPARCRSSRSRASSGCARRRLKTWADAAPCSIAAPACRLATPARCRGGGRFQQRAAVGGDCFREAGPPAGTAGRRAAGHARGGPEDRHRHLAAAGRRRIGGAQGSHHPAAGHISNWPTRCCRKRGQSDGGGVIPRYHKGDVPTVLVADDSDFFRGQIQRLVEAVGCKVLAAEDGQAAWEILDQHAGAVDLLATDVEMPRLDGLSLTRRIRADAALCRAAGDRPVFAGGRRRNRPRLGRWRERISGQAQQG